MSTYYTVHPRYTPGSGAMVDQETAEEVARAEVDFIAHALSGLCGAEQKARAERLGLRGIAEALVERHDHWEVHDLCTGERFKRLFPEKLRKQKFRRYCELEAHERQFVDAAPPAIEHYQEDGWFKVDVAPFDVFPTGYRVTVYEPEPVA